MIEPHHCESLTQHVLVETPCTEFPVGDVAIIGIMLCEPMMAYYDLIAVEEDWQAYVIIHINWNSK